MERFNLEKWLQDKSHKVVTRSGNPVRIVCWDRQSSDDDRCIVGLVDYGVREDTRYFDKLGHYSTYSEGFNDLFFADEEVELTKFEKDYEKLYKEALERAKYLKENTDSVGALDISACFEQIFPELRESENERIRKEIIRVFKGEISYSSKEENEKYIAWLEKQAEQKPAEWSEEDKEKLNSIIEVLGDNSLLVQWLKSLKPNHWKPTKEQIETIDMILTNESMDDNVARILRELKEQLEKLQKGE